MLQMFQAASASSVLAAVPARERDSLKAYMPGYMLACEILRAVLYCLAYFNGLHDYTIMREFHAHSCCLSQIVTTQSDRRIYLY